MILRRITEHVKAQNWFAVALDFFIVVIGVFVGLQVSNWNAARLDARQGAVFTERLKADLRIEAWNYDSLINYLQSVQTNADRALSILEGRAEGSDEQLLISAYRATQWAAGVRRRATFDELTSTGSIGLIKDTALRDAAVLIYNSPATQRAAEEGIESPYRMAFRKLLPVEIQDALGANCGDRFAPIGDYGVIRNQLDYDCATGLTPAQINLAAGALRAAPDIIPLLRLRAVNIRTQIGNLTFVNQDIMDSLHAIAADTP